MTRKVTVIVETGKDGFSCFMSGADDLDFCAIGSGKTARKAMEDFRIACDELRQSYAERNRVFPELDFEFVLDVGAFFSYYPINVTAFAEYAGINASQLRQYACGLRTPSKATIGKVREGIQKMANDIADGHLIDRPVLQYV